MTTFGDRLALHVNELLGLLQPLVHRLDCITRII